MGRHFTKYCHSRKQSCVSVLFNLYQRSRRRLSPVWYFIRVVYRQFSLVHILVGKLSDLVGRKLFLLMGSWGMAVLLLFFPLVTEVWEVYVLQIFLGIVGAMQKTSEKALLADVTDGGSRGASIGRYHFWTSIFSGGAVMLGGFIIDLFTLDIIFYISSIILFVSGFFILKIVEKGK